MSCRDFTSTNPVCRTVTILEPDSTILGATSSGSTDRSLDESGNTTIDSGATRVQVLFEVTKASENYRFEYLYVDALGLANPADVTAILVSKNAFGFLVDLVGSPSTVGYVLRWRAVVIDLTTLTDVDTPESLRVPIPAGVRTLTVTWTTPRSGSTYGFSELRVENLVDVLADQRIISVQVGVKTNGSFTIGLNPPAIGVNYYLIARSP